MDLLDQFGLNFDCSTVNMGNISSDNISIPLDVVKEETTNSYFGRLDIQSYEVRMAVLSSFKMIFIGILDTMTKLKVTPSIINNSLAFEIQSVNSLCSKMHVEDVSPIVDKSVCSHDSSECTDSHFSDNSILIEDTDYEPCNESDAIFRCIDGKLRFKRGKKWILIRNDNAGLRDGFYTIISRNFI